VMPCRPAAERDAKLRAFSSEVDTGRARKTRQNKNLELRF
jgi:hypothetical protein